MAVLEIVKAGNPVLKQKAEPISKVDSRLRKLLNDMAETMYSADGVGLAAPQVAKSIRCVVIDVGDDNGLLELINPVITEREGTAVDSGRCGAFCQGSGGIYQSLEQEKAFGGWRTFG